MEDAPEKDGGEIDVGTPFEEAMNETGIYFEQLIPLNVLLVILNTGFYILYLYHASKNDYRGIPWFISVWLSIIVPINSEQYKENKIVYFKYFRAQQDGSLVNGEEGRKLV